MNENKQQGNGLHRNGTGRDEVLNILRLYSDLGCCCRIVMFKTAFCVGGCLLLVGATLWGVVQVVHRPFLYLPTRVQPYGTSAFLALPRYSSGGFSLARDADGVLKPFPDRSTHVRGIIGNAVDIHLDSTGLLWVLDSGYIDTLKTPIKLNDAKVLALDADSGKMKKIVSLKGLVSGKAQYLCIDENSTGAQHLYISDGPARSIVVWNLSENDGHRVILPDRVMAHPVRSKVLYMALVRDKLYFTYFGSFNLYSIDTKGLLSGGKVVSVGRKDPRMIFLGVDRNKLLFRLAGVNEVLAWDTLKPLVQDNLELVDRSEGHLNQMAAVPNFGKLWILESDVKSFLGGNRPAHKFRPACKHRVHRSVIDNSTEVNSSS